MSTRPVSFIDDIFFFFCFLIITWSITSIHFCRSFVYLFIPLHYYYFFVKYFLSQHTFFAFLSCFWAFYFGVTRETFPHYYLLFLSFYLLLVIISCLCNGTSTTIQVSENKKKGIVTVKRCRKLIMYKECEGKQDMRESFS